MTAAEWEIVAYRDRDERLWTAHGGGWKGPNGEYITTVEGLEFGRGPLVIAEVDNPEALIGELVEVSSELVALLAQVDRLTERLASVDLRHALALDALVALHRHLLDVSRRCPTHAAASTNGCVGCDQAQRLQHAVVLFDRAARALAGQPVPAPA